jgi:hypothetical protein
MQESQSPLFRLMYVFNKKFNDDLGILNLIDYLGPKTKN